MTLTREEIEARRSTAAMIYCDKSRDETQRGDALMDMALCDLALSALSSRSALEEAAGADFNRLALAALDQCASALSSTGWLGACSLGTGVIK